MPMELMKKYQPRMAYEVLRENARQNLDPRLEKRLHDEVAKLHTIVQSPLGQQVPLSSEKPVPNLERLGNIRVERLRAAAGDDGFVAQNRAVAVVEGKDSSPSRA